MAPELTVELEKLTAWTARGNYIMARSTSEVEAWNRLVEAGLVERVVLSNLNHYRIIQH